MRIQEAARRAGMTQRAAKFYEEKGLLAVRKGENGYRDYTEADVDLLRRIQAYRKLGVGVPDIRRLLRGEADERALLRALLSQKRAEQNARESELAALEAYLAGLDAGTPDAAALDEALDFVGVAEAMRAQLPGFWGDYVAAHFARYLPAHLETGEQRDAFVRIVAFWDGVRIRVPLALRLSALLSRAAPPQGEAVPHAGVKILPHRAERFGTGE